jgi:DNA-binding PadR family transcriptional regulator
MSTQQHDAQREHDVQRAASGVLRMTIQVRAVLAVLLTDRHGELFGADIAHRAGLLPGTTYPILARLVRAGWAIGEWEQIDPRRAGRPRRCYYQLTGRGVVVAQQAQRSTPHQRGERLHR